MHRVASRDGCVPARACVGCVAPEDGVTKTVLCMAVVVSLMEQVGASKFDA